MTINLTPREIRLVKLALDNEIIDFDQRLSLMENKGRGTEAHKTRCELKRLASKINSGG